MGKAASEVKMIDDLVGSSMSWMVSVVQKGKFDLESKPHILQKFGSNDLQALLNDDLSQPAFEFGEILGFSHSSVVRYFQNMKKKIDST